jgi:hypothetical protein
MSRRPASVGSHGHVFIGRLRPAADHAAMPRPPFPGLLPSGTLLVLLVGLLAVLPARADDDHERARAAVVRGEVLPLDAVLARVPLRAGERLLDAELEREGGRWVYELELISADGRVREVELDARDGRWIEED